MPTTVLCFVRDGCAIDSSLQPCCTFPNSYPTSCFHSRTNLYPHIHLNTYSRTNGHSNARTHVYVDAQPFPHPNPYSNSHLDSAPTPTAVATEAPDINEEGDSFETAVVIEASNEFEGIAAEREWLQAHYPGYQKMGQALAEYNGKMYDIITILTSEEIEKNIYFDITSFYGKL